VIIIEHNLDVIRNADWVIDLGLKAARTADALWAKGAREDCRTPGSYTASPEALLQVHERPAYACGF